MRKRTIGGIVGGAAIAAAGLFQLMQSEPPNVVKLRVRWTVPTPVEGGPIDSTIVRAGLDAGTEQFVRRYLAAAGGTQMIDSFYFTRPGPGDSIVGYACAASKRRLLESDPSCKGWKYKEPAAELAIVESAIRPLPLPRTVLDRDSVCAKWQIAHPDSSPWIVINDSAVSECMRWGVVGPADSSKRSLYYWKQRGSATYVSENNVRMQAVADTYLRDSVATEAGKTYTVSFQKRGSKMTFAAGDRLVHVPASADWMDVAVRVTASGPKTYVAFDNDSLGVQYPTNYTVRGFRVQESEYTPNIAQYCFCARMSDGSMAIGNRDSLSPLILNYCTQECEFWAQEREL